MYRRNHLQLAFVQIEMASLTRCFLLLCIFIHCSVQKHVNISDTSACKAFESVTEIKTTLPNSDGWYT